MRDSRHSSCWLYGSEGWEVSTEGASRNITPVAAAEHAAIAAALIGRILILRLIPGLIGHISHLLSNLLKAPRPTAIM